jgi:hypothetical protein
MLTLLLDIGILETESPRFWLKDHLAALEGTPPATTEQNPLLQQQIVLPHEVF